jgi:DNA-binding GntR family transcriptional regulator
MTQRVVVRINATSKAERPKQTSVERVYTFVRQGIMQFSLKPGESISDIAIAKRIGISRTPVREALRQLELEGLVLHTPHRGWMVRALQRDDVENIFEIKECLEAMLIRQATKKLTSQDKGVLTKAMANMEEATSRKDQEAWLAADDCLETTLYLAAGNPRARQIVSSLNAQWHWVWVGIIELGDRMEQSAREHKAILAKVFAGDADGVEALALSHLSSVKQTLLTVLTNFVLPLTDVLGKGFKSSPSETRSRGA